MVCTRGALLSTAKKVKFYKKFKAFQALRFKDKREVIDNLEEIELDGFLAGLASPDADGFCDL